MDKMITKDKAYDIKNIRIKREKQEYKRTFFCDHNEWKPYDYSRYYKSNLNEKDFQLIYFYFGKKKDDFFYIQRGKDASKIFPQLIKDLNNEFFNTDTYMLNATEKLSGDYKSKNKTIRKTFVKETIGDLYDKDGNLVYDNYVLESITEEHQSKVKEYYESTTKKDILYVPGFVVDIDNHNYDATDKELERLAEQLVFFLAEDYNLAPHFITNTTRGLQVFFSFNKFNPNVKKVADLAKDLYGYIKLAVNNILEEVQKYTPSEKKFLVDNALSPFRQVVRLPGTINYKTGLTCHTIYADTSLRRYSMGETIGALKYALGYRSSGREYIKFTPKEKRKAKRNNINSILKKRINDDKLLLNHRGVGSRNACYCNMSISMISLGYTEAQMRDELLSTDNNVNYFKNSNEVDNFIRHIKDYYDNHKINGVFKLSNKKIENEWYAITDEEYQLLDFETYGISKNRELHWERRRINKSNEIKNIIIEYAKQTINNSVNISKIAKMFKKSRTTIYKYIKKFKEEILHLVKDLLKTKKETSEESSNNSPLGFSNCPRQIENLNSKFLNTFLDNRLTRKLKKKILEIKDVFRYTKPPDVMSDIQNAYNF